MLSLYLAMLEDENDQARFTVIYEKYSDLMGKIALSMTNDEILALDATDDAFVSIAKNIKSFPPSDNPKYECAYIQKVIKHATINAVKKQSQSTTILSLDAFEVSSKSTPLSEAIENEEIQIIIRSIDEMSDIYKDVLTLKYVYGFSDKEIASSLNIPQNTVHQKITRGTKILRERLESKRLG